MFWSGNDFWDISNELNRGWVMSFSTKCWHKVNKICQETSRKYKQSEVAQQRYHTPETYCGRFYVTNSQYQDQKAKKSQFIP